MFEAWGRELGDRCARPTLHDYAVLLVTLAAKLGAVHYRGQRPRDFYDEHFQERHVDQFQRDVRMVLRRQEILAIFERSDVARIVVDIGCGVGDIVKALPKSLRRVGVDLSARSLALAATGDRDVGFVCSSAYHLPFEDRAVDAVICLEVIEHLEDDGAAIREIARVLKRGGRLIVSVPNTYYFRSYVWLMGHYRHYTRSELEALCRAAGLVPVAQLNGYPRVQLVHLWVYGPMKLLAIVLGRLHGQYASVYDLRLPFGRQPVYDLLRPVFNWLAGRDVNLPVKGERQTFGLFKRT